MEFLAIRMIITTIIMKNSSINKEDYQITKFRLKLKKVYLTKGVVLDLTKYKTLNNEEQ